MKPRAVAICLLLPLLAACGDSPTGPADDEKPAGKPPTAADLQRIWVATRAEYTSNAQSGRKFDIVANGGSLTLDLTRLDQYTLSSTVRYSPSALTTGLSRNTWSVTGNQITLGNYGAPVTYTMQYDGKQLTLTSAHDRFAFTFDDMWNDREEDVSAILVLVGT